METNLRPLTLGEILDRTAQLYRTNFLLFAGIFAVTNGIVLVLVLLAEGLSPAYRAIQTTGKFQPGSWAVLAVVGLATLLLYGASTAAITRAVAWINLDEPATVRTAYRSTLPHLGRYLWLITIALLIILGVALLAVLALSIVVGIMAIVFAVALKGAGTAVATVGIVLGLLIDLAVFVVVAWVAARYALSIPACVVEDLKARKALRRSVELTKGSRGRIFLLFLLVGVIQIGLVLLTQAPFMIYKFSHHLQLPIGLSILSQIISVATGTLSGPILAAGLTLFYFDQRVRKEGYDIEWMMQAAGLTAESAPAPNPEPQPAAAPVEAAPAAESATEPVPTAEMTPATETPEERA